MERIAAHSDIPASISQTELITHENVLNATSSQPVLRLRLQKAKNDKKVGWSEGTVDNENMNKKKSKCCCIYKKVVAFGESSSEDDEECENCFGHPEKRLRNRKEPTDNHDVCSNENNNNNNNSNNDNLSQELFKM